MKIKTYEKFAESLVSTHQTPGAIVALTNGYEQGFGYRDRENQLPVTTDTVFGIGSITKVMTCIAILQLQEAGKLSIDDLVQTYVPELTFTGSRKSRSII
ncbi:serine hydrolase domain-containing protein [Bacillus sp. JCM 19041]|uniref:serine hydrolase domain-containing protein n=1 Tax=Bacillus sp. JCM 19041 TaxID=1460637 RepID=UPI000AB53A31